MRWPHDRSKRSDHAREVDHEVDREQHHRPPRRAQPRPRDRRAVRALQHHSSLHRKATSAARHRVMIRHTKDAHHRSTCAAQPDRGREKLAWRCARARRRSRHARLQWSFATQSSDGLQHLTRVRQRRERELHCQDQHALKGAKSEGASPKRTEPFTRVQQLF